MDVLLKGQGNSDTVEYLGRSGLTLIRGWKATVGRTAERGMYVTVDLANVVKGIQLKGPWNLSYGRRSTEELTMQGEYRSKRI